MPEHRLLASVRNAQGDKFVLLGHDDGSTVSIMLAGKEVGVVEVYGTRDGRWVRTGRMFDAAQELVTREVRESLVQMAALALHAHTEADNASTEMRSAARVTMNDILARVQEFKP